MGRVQLSLLRLDAPAPVNGTPSVPSAKSSNKGHTRIKDRAATLQAQRRLKMARSAHAYVRGSTVKFYEWLETAAGHAVPAGPAVWICGDCHSSNLGPIVNTEGDIDIQIRDLDQTVIGNPAHDLIRLALSLATAARGSDLPGVITASMLEQMLNGYSRAFSSTRGWQQKAPDPIRSIMADAFKRRWKHLVDERMPGAEVMLPRGRKFWNLSKPEARAIDGIFSSDELLELVRRGRGDDAKVEVLDAAYWMKGCSSLGLARYAVLLRIDIDDRSHMSLFDIKEAINAAAPRYPDYPMPRDNAMRVVEGARNLSPHLGERMLATRMLERGVFIRETFPQDLKIEIARLTRQQAGDVAEFMGFVVGRAHARQLKKDERLSWAKELKRNHSKALETPTWLWRCVVDLITTHEAAYLEHCRRYAMEQAAVTRA
jgi:uncharacterized protein (DUF2252 family)